ncbi:MAG: hypothetical protein R3F24_07565 [Gammaproteobacteria bacterium]
MVGPSRPIDTQRYFVMCVNSLGSCFGSTGPASVDPATGQAYGISFPVLALRTWPTPASLLVDHFDISRLHTVVGPPWVA